MSTEITDAVKLKVDKVGKIELLVKKTQKNKPWKSLASLLIRKLPSVCTYYSVSMDGLLTQIRLWQVLNGQLFP